MEEKCLHRGIVEGKRLQWDIVEGKMFVKEKDKELNVCKGEW